jgi:hypothetical protein
VAALGGRVEELTKWAKIFILSEMSYFISTTNFKFIRRIKPTSAYEGM